MFKVLKNIHCLLFSVYCIVVFCSCQNSQSNSISEDKSSKTLKVENKLKAVEVIDALKNADFPIDKIEYFTSETDFEKLLGKPNQYVEKAGWIDTRIKSNSADNFQGGGIEVFETEDLLEKREKQWLENQRNMGFENHYLAHKNVLMILDNSLTSQQVSDYEKILKSL